MDHPSTTPTKRIVVLIPCKNEAAGVAGVINGLPYERAAQHGYALEVHVIDNGSTDVTAHVARNAGACVHTELMPGKGYAMRCGFCHVPADTAYVVMVDGDGSYDPADLLSLIEPLEAGYAVAIGSRLAGRASRGSLSFVRRAGNHLFTHLVRVMYGVPVTDVLSGYWAWKREALVRLAPHLTATGFGLEMEMVSKTAHLGERLTCVPVRYAVRRGTSHLRPLRDGLRILGVLVRNVTWSPARSVPFRVVPAQGVPTS